MFIVPELSNSFYGSLPLYEEVSINRLCITLYTQLENYFEQIAEQSEKDIVNATHQARKTLKSYRAFIKLMRTCLQTEDWKSANYLLRDLGKEFSEMRDAHVRGMLLSELNKNLKSRILQKFIEENRNQTEKIEKVLLSQPNQFNELSRQIRESAILNKLFKQTLIRKKCIIESFSITFLKSYEAFTGSQQIKTEEAFHEWRKRLKDLLNQIKLFRPERDLVDNKQFIRIDTLCEEMGMLNDMAMLKEWIEDEVSKYEKETESAGILTFLDKKINSFQHRITESGNSFYHDRDEILHSLELLIQNE